MVLPFRAIRLDYRTASGGSGSARIVIGTTRAGVLLDARPANAAQLTTLFEGGAITDPVQTFKISGDGAGDLERTFSISWLQVEQESASEMP
jgi:hypothetical protein